TRGGCLRRLREVDRCMTNARSGLQPKAGTVASSGPVAALVLLAGATPAGVVAAELGTALDGTSRLSVRAGGRGDSGSRGRGRRAHCLGGARQLLTALFHATHRLRWLLHHGHPEEGVGYVLADG